MSEETANPHTRYFTVSHTPGKYRTPCIIISGKYLLNLGYKIGQLARVTLNGDGTVNIDQHDLPHHVHADAVQR